MRSDQEERWFKQTLHDLDRDEGFREFAYPDPLSELHRRYPPRRYGWGYKPATEIIKELKIKDISLGDPWTVGHGFTRGVTPSSRISHEESLVRLSRELIAHLPVLDKVLPEWRMYPDFVKTVLANMAFNLGSRFWQFKNTIRAFANHDWPAAADLMTRSLWFSQVGARAKRLVWRLRNGMIQPDQLVAPDFSNVISSVTSTEEVKRQGD
jgi:GH24 family phage-related lysozyme (muramidase)